MSEDESLIAGPSEDGYVYIWHKDNNEKFT